MSFRLRTILGIALIEAVLLLALVWSSLSFLQRSNESALQDRVQTTLKLVISTTKDAVLSTDLAYLESYVQELLGNPGVVYARIMDQHLSLAEAGDPALLARAFAGDTQLGLVDDDVYDIGGVIEEAGQRYGRVEMGFSVSEIRRDYEVARTRMSAIAVLEMVLVALFSFVLGTYLTRQLKQLHEASLRIAEGGPGEQVPVSGSDELAATARAFNLMSSRLKSLYDQLVHSYQGLFAGVSDGIVVVDTNGRVIEVNESAAVMFRCSRADMLGREMGAFVPEPFDVQHWSVHQREVIGRTAHDGPLELDVSVSPMRMEGQGEAMLCIVRNITERRRSERQVAEYARRLELQNKELQDFAYVASHDLQEPLRKVRTYGLMLNEEFTQQLPDAAGHYIHRMLDAAQRMQLLISDLLSYSRINTRTEPFEQVDLQLLVREVREDLEVAISEAGATLEFSQLPGVIGDPTQLRQLFQNLIGNAIKFRKPDHAPNVRIESETLVSAPDPSSTGSDAQPCHRIRVIDDGIGFEQEFGERIFEVFERLHARHKYEGTGIGLAICRKIVRRHGGSISAQPGSAGGAVFEILLPVNPLPDKTDDHDRTC